VDGRSSVALLPSRCLVSHPDFLVGDFFAADFFVLLFFPVICRLSLAAEEGEAAQADMESQA
jgi:hypothetical protein